MTIQNHSYSIDRYDNNTNNGTNVPGMVVGGLLFGIVGAVIGANAGSNKTTTVHHQETISYLEPVIIKIVVDDLNNPVVSIQFNDKIKEGLYTLDIIQQARFLQILLELIILGVRIPKGMTYEKLEGLRDWISVKFKNNNLSQETIIKALTEALN